MPLNASISPSTTPRTAPCGIQATSGSSAVQPGTCAEPVEAITANRNRARSLVKCAIVASSHVTADQQYRRTLEISTRSINRTAKHSKPPHACCGSNRVTLDDRPLPVHTDKQTFSGSVGLSQKCHERTLALQKNRASQDRTRVRLSWLSFHSVTTDRGQADSRKLRREGISAL